MFPLESTIESLGFTSKEAQVLLELYRHRRANVSVLASAMKQPRTTVALMLEKLQKKNAVVKVRVANHTEWEAVDPEHLHAHRDEQLRAFKTHIEPLRALSRAKSSKEKSVIEYYRGKEGLLRAYDLLLELDRAERIYGFEGSASMMEKLALFTEEETLRWQSSLKKRGIILEVAVSDKLLKILKKTTTKHLRNLLGRATIATTIPDELMDFESDIFVFRETAFIMVPSEKLAIVIRERKISRVLKALLIYAINAGEKIDLNAAIKQELATRI